MGNGNRVVLSVKYIMPVLVLGALVMAGCKSKLPAFFRKETVSSEAAQLDSFASEYGSQTIWTTNWVKASERARSEGKLVMANFTGSDWCTWCVKLEKEVFDTDEFRNWAATNVVPLKLDYPRDKKKQSSDQRFHNSQFAERYGPYVKGYPTILFLDDRGEVVGQMGYAKGGPAGWIAKAESKLGDSPTRHSPF